MHLVPSPSIEGEAEVDRVLMKIMLEKYLFAYEQHDLHKKAGMGVSKQGQLQPRFPFINVKGPILPYEIIQR